MLLRPEVGRYYEQITRMWDVVDRRRTLVVIFEEFSANPRRTLEGVLKFLGIDHSLENFKAQVHRKFAVARGPVVRLLLQEPVDRPGSRDAPFSWVKSGDSSRLLVKKAAKPQMSEEARSLLTTYYADDVHALQALLGRPLPWPHLAGASPR